MSKEPGLPAAYERIGRVLERIEQDVPGVLTNSDGLEVVDSHPGGKAMEIRVTLLIDEAKFDAADETDAH